MEGLLEPDSTLSTEREKLVACNNADGSMVEVERGLAVPFDGQRILDPIDINIRGPSAERGERDSEIMRARCRSTSTLSEPSLSFRLPRCFHL
jgi:hypothetical protein